MAQVAETRLDYQKVALRVDFDKRGSVNWVWWRSHTKFTIGEFIPGLRTGDSEIMAVGQARYWNSPESVEAEV